jgi:hypothetical protein
MQDTLCKNNLNFVKVVPIIYANLNVGIVVVSDNKETLLLHRPSYQPGFVLSIVVELCSALFLSVS